MEQAGEGATRAALLLLPAEPPATRPRRRQHNGPARGRPHHGRQPATDAAGDGRRPPRPERPAAPAVRHTAAAVGVAAHPRRPGLVPLVRPADARLRPGGVAAGPTGLD